MTPVRSLKRDRGRQCHFLSAVKQPGAQTTLPPTSRVTGVDVLEIPRGAPKLTAVDSTLWKNTVGKPPFPSHRVSLSYTRWETCAGTVRTVSYTQRCPPARGGNGLSTNVWSPYVTRVCLKTCAGNHLEGELSSIWGDDPVEKPFPSRNVLFQDVTNCVKTSVGPRRDVPALSSSRCHNTLGQPPFVERLVSLKLEVSETRRGFPSGLRCTQLWERTLCANHLFTNVLLPSVRTVGKPALGLCGKSHILNSVQLHYGGERRSSHVFSFLRDTRLETWARCRLLDMGRGNFGERIFQGKSCVTT